MNDNDIVDNENFKKWFGKSLILDDYDEPLVVYHGTTSEFYTFDIHKANNEAFAGVGFYFSSSPDDAEHNYASVSSPDLLSKKEQFIEAIESNIDFINSEDYTEDEIKNSIKNFNQFISELSKEDNDYFKKVNTIHKYLNDNQLLLGKDDSDILLNAFYSIIEKKNDGLTHAVYLKMENPFFLEKQEWEETFILGEDIKNNFSEFLLDNQNSEVLINHLLENLQYYASVEIENELSIDKTSFFDIIDVNLEDLEDEDYEHTYPRELLLKLSEFWDNQIGEDEYLTGSFEQLQIVEQFKSFVKTNYSHILCSRDLDELDGFIVEDEIICADNLLTQIKSELMFFHDYPSEGLTASNVFFDFIYSLGFDGIVMNPNRFKNMDIIDGTMHYIVKNPNQVKLADGLNTHFSSENDDIRFKKVMIKPELSITQNEAFSTIEQFHIAFPNLPYTRIFQTQKDIEKFTNEKSIVAGFYSTENKKPFVGIILENINSIQQLEKVLIHEHLGHASLRNILGQEYESTMMNIFNYLEKNNAINIDSSWLKKDKIEVAEEFFASSMETKNKFSNTLLTKVASAISKIIRSVFKDFPFTKNELSILQEKSYYTAKSKNSKII